MKLKLAALLLLAATPALARPSQDSPPQSAPTSRATQQPTPDGSAVADWVARLKPGQYLWWPQAAPSGPTVMMINRTTQRAVLYRNGVPIGISTVSTGRPGHLTPTGVFTVLEKQVTHFSSIYDSAPMPFMQRLTWGGVALHGGQLPGYPASHGCIRLPIGFARLIYPVTSLGMTVVITDTAALPALVTTDGLFASTAAGSAGATLWEPERAPSGPLSIIVSAADKRMFVLRNGHEIGSAPIETKGVIDRPYLYLLQSVDAGGQRWARVALNGEDIDGPAMPWEQVAVPQDFWTLIAPLLAPTVSVVVVPDHVVPAAPLGKAP